MVKQYNIQLPSYSRGFHIITNEVLKGISDALPKEGMMHVFIKHTSASIMINEAADPDVATDLESSFNTIVKENEPYYVHTIEGPDDMPAHIKAAMIGSSVTLPITDGQLNLGTWQGIYLCEFRNQGGNRKLVVTVYE